MKKFSIPIILFFLVILISSSAFADCQGCCSGHGGVVCNDGVTECADGSSLSWTCIRKDCDDCIIFPSSHPEGSVLATFASGYGSAADEFSIYIWRESYAVWVEIEIEGENRPFICSSSFIIIQNEMQNDTARLITHSDDTQCGDVYINSVYRLSQYSSSDNLADFNHNFTLLFDGGENVYTIDMDYNNSPPIASAGNDQNVEAGDEVWLDASNCLDEEGDPLTYLWRQVSGESVTLNNETIKNPTFTAPDVYGSDDLTFHITVEDGTFRTADEVTITVNEHVADKNDGGGGGCFLKAIKKGKQASTKWMNNKNKE